MDDGSVGLQIGFFLTAAITVGSALVAAFAKRIVYSAFALLATFGGVSALYAILGNDFLAITQAVVYVGGILILLVFGVLLTDRVPEEYRVSRPRKYLPALLASGLVFTGLAWAITASKWPSALAGPLPDPESTIAPIGRSLLTDYLLPFEFASLLLLVVLVGAARVARGGSR